MDIDSKAIKRREKFASKIRNHPIMVLGGIFGTILGAWASIVIISEYYENHRLHEQILSDSAKSSSNTNVLDASTIRTEESSSTPVNVEKQGTNDGLSVTLTGSTPSTTNYLFTIQNDSDAYTIWFNIKVDGKWEKRDESLDPHFWTVYCINNTKTVEIWYDSSAFVEGSDIYKTITGFEILRFPLDTDWNHAFHYSFSINQNGEFQLKKNQKFADFGLQASRIP